MKKLLYGLLMAQLGAVIGCSSLGLRGGSYPDSALSNPNPAPASMAPPQFADGGASPLLDETYLNSQADFHFTMAETMSYAGQSERAIEGYKMTLVYDPRSVHVRLRLASEYVRMGMVTEAIEQAQVAMEIAPDNIEARMVLGGLYTGLKMYAPAREQFQEVTKIQPDHPEASIYLGALLAEEKKYDEAIQYFEKLAKNEEFGNTERAYYFIGRVRAEQGDEFTDKARAAFEKALSVKPEFPEATIALANLCKRDGKTAAMEKLLSSYQDKFGPDRDMARYLSQSYLEREEFAKALEQLEILDSFERDNLNVKIQIALILIEQQKYVEAAQRLEDVLVQAPDSDKVRYYLGAVYEEISRGDMAVDHYQKIPPDSTYFADATIHIAHILKAKGDIRKAVNVMEKGVAAQPEAPQMYAFWATLLDDLKDYRKAYSMLNDAVERFPSSTQLRFFLGTIQDRLGHRDETIAAMKKVIELDSQHVQALNYLAYTYAEMGTELDEALELAQRALRLQPNDGYILDTIGWIHFKQGKNDRAIELLEAAFRIKSDEAIIAEHLGDAYLRNQMWSKAQKMYMRAAKLEPDKIRSRQIAEKIANLQLQRQSPTRSPASLPGAYAE